jgi:hypothetical protein
MDPGGVALAGKKKSTRKDGAEVATAPDPRLPLGVGAAAYAQVLADLKAVVADLEPPKEPKPGDLFDALMHIAFADGVSCGIGQEVLRRINDNFVDRNEFRVSEAYEVEDLMRDLQIPDAFDRCLMVREAVGQIYNDQNGMELGFLREATISDRNAFFQRVPALRPYVVGWMHNLLTVEELVLSDKSLLRVQQRLGMDPKEPGLDAFLAELRAMLRPFGHLPLEVGKHLPSGKPNHSHVLCSACILVRLAPAGRRR